MTKENDDILNMLLGGAIGAMLASPKIEDKQDLEKYRQMQKEMSERQKKVGDLSYISKLLNDPRYNKAFIESFRMYLYGFFRGAVIISSAIIECLLKDKYGNKKFKDLIEEAYKNKFVDETDYHLLHSLRSERNYSAHEILKEVTEDNAVLIIRIVNKIMYKFI